MISGRRRVFFRLSGEFPSLALSELLTLLSTFSVEFEVVKLKGRYLTISVPGGDISVGPLKRSGLTKAMGVEDKPERGEISVEVWRVKSEVDGEEARRRIKKLKDELREAEVKMKLAGEDRGGWAIYMDVEESALLRIVKRRDRGILYRSNTYRPFRKPISIDPRLARAAVNLLAIPPGGTFFDPFCGTGGIALEAGLMGYRVFISDADPDMVRGAVKNLKHFEVSASFSAPLPVSQIPVKIPDKVDGIATDPPYGRSSRIVGEPLKDLASALPSILKKGGRLLLVLHREEDVREMSGYLNLIELHSRRVHGSLTRYFALFEMR